MVFASYLDPLSSGGADTQTTSLQLAGCRAQHLAYKADFQEIIAKGPQL